MSRTESAARQAQAADRVRWQHSLRTRIALWSTLINVVLLLLVTVATAWVARRIIIDDSRRNVRASAQEATYRLQGAMQSVSTTADGLSGLVSRSALSPEQLGEVLRMLVGATPGSSGGLLVIESADRHQPRFARYIATSGKDRDFLADHYPFHTKVWYQRTLASPYGWWSEPYPQVTSGGVWMVTYNLPLGRGRSRGGGGQGGTVRGMISLDIPADSLVRHIEALANLPGWQVGLVAPDGTLALHPEAGAHGPVLLHPETQPRSGPELPRIPETLGMYIRLHHRADLAPVAEGIQRHQSMSYDHRNARTGEYLFTVLEPVGDSGWYLFVSQAHSLNVANLNRTVLLVIALGTLLALVCALLVMRLARRISQPVEQLAEAAADFAHGRYDTPVPQTARRNEVGLLARALEYARTSIRRQLSEIEEMGAARQKLESELSIAHDIQLSMLSPTRVIELQDTQLQAWAVLEPAKAVGGDFYSFIERGEDELWFAIGDVSDKGVPAALFMARAVTVLEVAAQTSASPSQVLAEASRRLVEGNDACMFATVLCGHIDLRSGRCTLANAGHDAPVLLQPNGDAELLRMQSGPPLGFEVCNEFPLWHGQLDAGASLVCYTDGVTEAFDPDNQPFGEARLLQALGARRSAEQNCLQVIAQVHAFAGSAAQSDDITVLVLRLDRPAPTAEPTADT